MLAPYYSLYHWTTGPARTVDRVRALHEDGVERLEFGSLNAHEPGLVPFLRTLAGRALLHNYFPPPTESFVFNLASASARIQSRSIQLATEALRLSGEIGAPCYAVHAGFVTDPTGFDGVSFVFPSPTDEGERRRSYSRFLAAINDLLPIANAAHVALLIENNVCPRRLRGRLLLQTAEEFDELFGDLGSSAGSLGILLDTGHLIVTCNTFEETPLDFVLRHRERILALHLHENDGREDLHRPVTSEGLSLSLASAADRVRWVTVEAKCQTLNEIKEQLAFVSQQLQVRRPA
jgi:sugar phosphate isomerase/epimerase